MSGRMHGREAAVGPCEERKEEGSELELFVIGPTAAEGMGCCCCCCCCC